ncbi:uncharacterized protein B0I36DRAFT_121851 [Microdochium trichocladiopsis]|uniref:Uncharacterized protein n=1 Tax=Microdochium trichocladiopsis TaxID=1682393 RepID=A0A9P8Y7G7_9PEZI|nr:uncharacterized protein B0I36DRAFT_121851 [Microdochium trichocladiopsis]KAH7031347.1 hypothetical protein B0I36DRAFT_121851 [Microdochium trichocladiopsis]
MPSASNHPSLPGGAGTALTMPSPARHGQRRTEATQGLRPRRPTWAGDSFDLECRHDRPGGVNRNTVLAAGGPPRPSTLVSVSRHGPWCLPGTSCCRPLPLISPRSFPLFSVCFLPSPSLLQTTDRSFHPFFVRCSVFFFFHSLVRLRHCLLASNFWYC